MMRNSVWGREIRWLLSSTLGGKWMSRWPPQDCQSEMKRFIMIMKVVIITQVKKHAHVRFHHSRDTLHERETQREREREREKERKKGVGML
jgi:hypothetical protein